MHTRSTREFDSPNFATSARASVLQGNAGTMITTDAKTERQLETSLCLGIRSSWNGHDVLADTRITKTAHEVLETANTGTTTTSLS
ncbi:hypothetical protein GN958_ATG02111 [Phytophthora infestans]|uniref:Uncharacterized protein n=1 Tax=Phytophthora infestans TaxID=4787 RepID=A0A8S9VBB3_PHYIN|nr:hypothetical protein GN958_ATG02111 [Phytophthora infestans]